MRYFLGADVGASKTQVLIADEAGQVVGAGRSGPGNHETVGYAGLENALREATAQALAEARLSIPQIAGAGFGIGGLDWDMEKDAHLRAIATLGLRAPVAAVNDALIGLVAGAEEGWGIAVVAGTGCNCRGWDRTRQKEGQVTGGSLFMGEGAGAGELMMQAVRAVAHAWTKRGPATQLTELFLQHTQAPNVPDLLYGLTEARYHIPASLAPRVFELAEAGDAVAQGLLQWAGTELGEMVNAVTHQLGFEALAFEVVLVGSLFKGGAWLTEPLQATVRPVAPRARLVRLQAPPVVGAVLLGMEQAGIEIASARANLLASAENIYRLRTPKPH